MAATKTVLGFDPARTFQVDAEVLAHAREVVDAAGAARRVAARFDAWAAGEPATAALLDRMRTRELPDGWTAALPDVPRRPQGHGHPQGVRATS